MGKLEPKVDHAVDIYLYCPLTSNGLNYAANDPSNNYGEECLKFSSD
jgi:hypothetical protein